MFARIRPSGEWINLTSIDGSEMEVIDRHLSQAIDGTNGGAYDPSGTITIGGGGLEVAANFNVSGTGAFAVQASVGSAVFLCPVILDNATQPFVVVHDALVLGASHLTGDVTVDGALTMTGSGTLFVNGLASFQGIVGFDQTVQMHSSLQCSTNVDVGENFSVAGDSAFVGALAVTGQTDLQNVGVEVLRANDELILTGEGRIRYRLDITGLDGLSVGQVENHSYRECDVVMTGGQGVMQGDFTWKITADGAENGSIMWVSRANDVNLHIVTVTNDDGSVIAYLGTTTVLACPLVFYSGKWLRML